MELSGIIFQEKMVGIDLEGKSYLSIPSFDHDGDYQARPESDMFSFLPEEVVVLSSCNGLICCRSSCGSMTEPKKPTFYICNPANKGWISLDCPQFYGLGSFALAFDPYPTTKFSLVRVQQNVIDSVYGNGMLSTYFHVYSSENKCWTKSLANCLYKFDVMENVPGVYIKGILYWRGNIIGDFLSGDDILSFDVQKEAALVISPPKPDTGFRVTSIGEWDMHLHYVVITSQGLHVFYLQNYDEAKWELKLSKPLEDIGRANTKFNNKLKEFMVLCYSWKIGILSFKEGVLVMFFEDAIFYYHIERNMAVEACKQKDLSSSGKPLLAFPFSNNVGPLM